MPDHLQAIAAAEGPDALAQAVASAARESGVRYVSWRDMSRVGQVRGVTTCPAEWVARYVATGLGRHDPAFDPRVHRASAHGFLLDQGSPVAPSTRGGFEMFEEVRGLGVTASYAVPLGPRAPGRRPLANFLSDVPRRELDDWRREAGPKLDLLALLLDAGMARVGAPERSDEAEAEAGALSARQREALTWLARGLRTARIAEAMDVSERMVEVHVAEARRRLSAATREQAVAAAILRGEIEP
ncbi:MAG: LuxR C-terminal-related transcriptional regulator [Pseudomonadota bacterium]